MLWVYRFDNSGQCNLREQPLIVIIIIIIIIIIKISLIKRC
jgi:hypothetical protein